MVLNQLTINGLKGQNHTYGFGAANAIVGPNFSGKTAIVEAIRLLCTGKIPGVKKPTDIIVSGKFDNGSKLSREINSKGTVGTSLDEMPDLDTPLLNPEHYFGLTDRERTDYVFSRVKLPAELRTAGILAELHRITLGEDHTELLEKTKAHVIEDLRGVFEGPESIQDKLTHALDSLRERFTYWNRRARETQGAVTTLTELKLREQQTTAAPRADLAKDAEKVQEELDEIATAMGVSRGAIEAADSAAAHKKQYQRWLDADRTDYEAIIKKTKRSRSEISKAIEDLTNSIFPVDTKSRRRELEALGADDDEFREKIASVEGRKREAKEKLEGLKKHKRCPWCESDAEGWKDKAAATLRQVVSTSETVITKAKADQETNRDKMVVIAKEIEQYEAATKRMGELQTKFEGLTAEITKVEAERDRDEANRKKWQAELDNIIVPATFSDKKTIAELEERRKVLLTRKGELFTIHTAETKLRQDLIRAQEAAKEHTEADAQRIMTKKVQEKLNQIREAMIETVFGRLIGVANEMIEGILLSPLVFNDGVIGRFEGPHFVEHYWFSGTEKALAYIAIALALSQESQFKLVILDEFGRLDSGNRDKIMERLLALLKEDKIDQFFIVGTSETLPDYESDSDTPIVKLITVGK